MVQSVPIEADENQLVYIIYLSLILINEYIPSNDQMNQFPSTWELYGTGFVLIILGVNINRYIQLRR